MGEASNVALWSAVVLAGVYHGLNPGMGWPLAVSAALMERRSSALARALALLGLGHFLAMAVVLLPFSLVGSLVQWETTIRLVASSIAVGYGLYLLLSRSHHPRYLARIAPHRLVWWSFLAATAHGAGLMLLPIFLSMDQMGMEGDHGAMMQLVGENAAPALFVALVHSLAMVAAGALLAVLVYRWLGVKAVSRTWLNLDVVWALSLLLVGLLSAAQTLWW